MANLDTNVSTHFFPFVDLKAQYRAIKPEIDAAIERVMDSGQFILGSEVESLEKEIADYCGSRFAIACASGSDALLLALMALEVGQGDEVITTPFTFVATAGAIARLQARPVFVDINPTTFNLDPAELQSAMTSKTRAIIPVHLFGMAADMDAITTLAKRSSVPVVEDAAQAIGATYGGRFLGTIGLCGCFSFFPSKNLGGVGDGGMLTTDDKNMADRLRVLHLHGGRSKYEYQLIGMNSRLDALQAAVLRVKLRHLDSWAAKRIDKARRYAQLFEDRGLTSIVRLPQVATNCTHVYNQYVVRVPRRDELRAFLRERGVPSEIYYPKPLHLQPAFAYLGYKPRNLPESEAASEEVLALPIFPDLTDQQQSLVVASMAAFYSDRSSCTRPAAIPF
ncbi:MAG TPA: DegT/DnrJ/EryC1/StrS family aminotransferase [Terriglobales bacterium]|nr:DegT/DnrJ/EryC1/StrS family aminotransferase [Terriglobales bacterium]